MAVTSTQSQNPASVCNIAIGRYLTSSTAAAITITIGFKARFVRVCNITSSDQMEWFEGMDAASANKRLLAGTGSLITTLGITVSDKSFVIGLDTDVNVINEQISWMALG